MALSISDLRERTTVSIEEAGEVLSIKRTSAYAAARNGLLPTIRVGRRIVVSAPALLRMIDPTPTAADDVPPAA